MPIGVPVPWRLTAICHTGIGSGNIVAIIGIITALKAHHISAVGYLEFPGPNGGILRIIFEPDSDVNIGFELQGGCRSLCRVAFNVHCWLCGTSVLLIEECQR